MRVAAVVAVVAVASLAFVSAGAAQGTPPTITITASATELAVSTAGPVASGPTRFEVVRSGTGDLSISLAALRPGVTRAQFEAALASGDSDAAIELVHLDVAVDMTGAEDRRAVTASLRPNSTYLVLNVTGDRPSDWEIAQLATTGASTGAAAPQPDARVRMVDLRFRGARTLPRDGIVRFENAGWAPHFAFAIPLRRGARARAVGRALRAGNDRRLVRLLDFRHGVQPQGLITRGAVNDNEVRFPRRGRYAMVCFFEGHNTQGMYRIVRVR